MGFESVLLVFRGCLYFATFLIISSYHPHGARWRWGVSLLSVGLAGSSLAFSVQIATAWDANVFGGPQWLPTIYCGCIFGLVARCRGNLAKMIPPYRRRAST